MITLIKNYFTAAIPTKEDLAEAKQICIKEGCIVDLMWCLSVYTGWHHAYIDKDSDLETIYKTEVQKVYPV